MIEVESNCSERASNLPLSLKQCQNARNLPADDYINKEWPGNFFLAEPVKVYPIPTSCYGPYM